MIRLKLAALMVFALLLIRDVRAEPGKIELARPGELPVAIDLHGSVVVGTRLYVFGGKTATEWSDRVWSAEITSAASLSSWREEPRLPELRTHIGRLVQAVNNRIYILGGLSPSVPDLSNLGIRGGKDVLWTTVRTDGSLDDWTRGAPFVGSCPVNGSSCSDGKRLYLVGGRPGGKATADVLMSTVGDSGAPGPWSTVSTLPLALQYHGADLMNGRIYVWGGHGDEVAPINDKVFSASVGAAGELGPWRTDSVMPRALYRSGFLGFNDFLVCVGGIHSSVQSTSDIWFAKLEGETVGEWQMVDSDLESHLYHPVAIDRDRGAAYVTGGRKGKAGKSTANHDIVATVQAFQLPQPAAASNPGAGANGDGVAFSSLSEALVDSKTSGRPVLVYFYSPQVPLCNRIYDALKSDPDSASLASRYALAAVDVRGPESARSYEYGVFQVPSLLILKQDGKPGDMLRGAKSWDEMKAWLSAPH